MALATEALAMVAVSGELRAAVLMLTIEPTAGRSTAGRSEASGTAEGVVERPEELLRAGGSEPWTSVVTADGVTEVSIGLAVDSVTMERRRSARLGLATTAQATTCERGPWRTRSGMARQPRAGGAAEEEKWALADAISLVRTLRRKRSQGPVNGTRDP